MPARAARAFARIHRCEEAAVHNSCLARMEILASFSAGHGTRPVRSRSPSPGALRPRPGCGSPCSGGCRGQGRRGLEEGEGLGLALQAGLGGGLEQGEVVSEWEQSGSRAAATATEPPASGLPGDLLRRALAPPGRWPPPDLGDVG